MVPDKSLEKVAGLRQTIDGILNIASIPIAAMLLSIWNIHSILSIDIITAIIGVLLLSVVKFKKEDAPSISEKKRDFKSLIIGFKLLVSYKYIFYKSLLSASINLALTPAITFLPLLVKDKLQKGPEMLALIQVSFGIGIVVGGLLMSTWGGFRKRMISVLLGLGILGLSLFTAGIIANLEVSYSYFLVVPMFFGGLSLSISNSSSGAITQSKVNREDLGKVSGASSSISQFMIPVGLLIAIPVTELIGITGWFIFAGLFNLLIVLVFSFNKEFLGYSLQNEKLKLKTA